MTAPFVGFLCSHARAAGYEQRISPEAIACGRIWGDGLLEQSLHTACYPCDWDTVDGDELVFLIPALASKPRSRGEDGDFGIEARSRQALLARIRYVLRRLGTTAVDVDRSDENSAAQIIDRSAVVASVAWRDALRHGDVDLTEDCAAGRGDHAERDEWIYELSVLACLDRLHAGAATETTERVQPTADATLADCLAASIFSGLNGAYVYPQFNWAHELLGAGVWLGHLGRGRAALMPTFVAECLIGYLENAEMPNDAGRCTALLRHVAELAVGERRLLAVARRVNQSGRPAVVKAKPTAGGCTRPIWNEALAARISQRLE